MNFKSSGKEEEVVRRPLRPIHLWTRPCLSYLPIKPNPLLIHPPTDSKLVTPYHSPKRAHEDKLMGLLQLCQLCQPISLSRKGQAKGRAP